MTKKEAIQVLNMVEAHGGLVIQAKEMAIKALQEPETIPLTYDEKCIFLAAMGRERRICKKLDEEPEIKAKPLVPIVDEIERKVKAVLWGENNG